MGAFSRVWLLLLIVYATAQTGAAFTCKKKHMFGIETEFSCPRPGDDPAKQFCCGDDDDVHCCEFPIELDEDTVEAIGKIIGAVIGAIAFMLVLCVVCCCCCPFCLLAKRRQRGNVLGSGTAMTVTVQQPGQPQSAYPQQPQQYPQQPQQYPQQPQQYPQQPQYPPQPQPGYPGAPQPGYPQPSPGYPGDQPPAYAEKPAAFNPNY